MGGRGCRYVCSMKGELQQAQCGNRRSWHGANFTLGGLQDCPGLPQSLDTGYMSPSRQWGDPKLTRHQERYLILAQGALSQPSVSGHPCSLRSPPPRSGWHHPPMQTQMERGKSGKATWALPASSSPAGANAWSGRSLDLEPLGAWGCAYICLANPEKALGCSCQVLCGDPIPCFTDLGALSFCTSCCFGGSTCFQGLQPSPQVIHQAFEFPSKAPRRKIPPN